MSYAVLNVLLLHGQLVLTSDSEANWTKTYSLKWIPIITGVDA